MKTKGWIDGLAMVVAIGALVVGVGGIALVSTDSGIRLAVENGQVVITDVLPYSPASLGFPMATAVGAGAGTGAEMTTALRPGMIVTNLNWTTLISLPHYVYPDGQPTFDPATGGLQVPQPVGISPSRPQPQVDAAQLPGLIASPVDNISALTPQELANWDAAASSVRSADFGLFSGSGADFVLAAGVIAFLLVAWWLRSGRAGAALQRIALPAALAVAGPMVLSPLNASYSLAGIAGYSLLMPMTLVPLAAALVLRVEWRVGGLVAAAASTVCAASAVAIGLSRLSDGLGADQALPISVIAGGMTALPGLAAAWRRAASADGNETAADAPTDPRGRIVRGAAYAVIGLTPLFAISTAIGPYWPVLPVWLAVVWVAGRVTVRPLVRLAGLAQLQRDLVVAATEAERARVAADIHDDALQELTLLVRRLDAAGDVEGAAIARTVSDRLRAICGDLRLPILDDLGIGPALDWLVLRIERLAGGEVRLERADGTRPPAEVELAFFRVAQEALSNAVKHGRPPIVVRYRSADGYATLSIDDAGAGIPNEARDRAEADGHHYGLLNMAQRAEAIGAILDIRRWPAGGTHVGLEWRRAE